MKYLVSIGARQLEVVIDGDHVSVDGAAVAAQLRPRAGSPEWLLNIAGRQRTVALAYQGDDLWTVALAGAAYDVTVRDERTAQIRALAGSGRGGAAGGTVKAPMPGLVVRVLVTPGEVVEAGQSLVVLEAMKMENELKAPAAGVVESVTATPGQAVEKGAALVVIGEPTDG